MAKETGLGITSINVDDSGGTARAITNDVTNFGISIPSNQQDVTGVDKSAMERLYLLADASVTLNGVFNDAATTGAHTVLKNYRTLAASQVGRTTAFSISGQTLSMEIAFSDYNLTRAADGSLTWAAPGTLADGTVPSWA